ncbi:hypothetical protein [Caballeronia zhejiangensis]|uniref:hypothetical protein n=1 Tax=Caballeronia zhejiangensis TaxID=871203 RepID=UPI001F526918|nr:hypothetical protein [Caballeronia zhejiangensis]MCI1046930.1 hypothetical protein [Caballeronia zhejiangensis]
MNALTNNAEPEKLAWWRELIVKLIPVYFVIGIICIAGVFDSNSDLITRIIAGVFAVPVMLLLMYQFVFKPLLFIFAVCLRIALAMLPLVFIGFCLGIGVFIAMHLL